MKLFRGLFVLSLSSLLPCLSFLPPSLLPCPLHHLHASPTSAVALDGPLLPYLFPNPPPETFKLPLPPNQLHPTLLPRPGVAPNDVLGALLVSLCLEGLGPSGRVVVVGGEALDSTNNILYALLPPC